MDDNLLEAIVAMVGGEAQRASMKHAPMHSHHEASAVIREEFEEYWDLVKLNPKKPMVHPTKGTPLSVEQYKTELQTELTHTAAMCVRAIHDLC